MDKYTAINQYEQHILKGRPFQFQSLYSDKDEKKKYEEREAYAKDIIRYAIEHVLHWNAEDAVEFMNDNIFEQLGLKPLLRYIEWPPELKRGKDLDYAVYISLNESKRFPRAKILTRCYEQVESGELDAYPRYLFLYEEGDRNATFILMKLISETMAHDSIEDLYKRFSHPVIARHMLTEHKLKNVVTNMFASPLRYLHHSLPEEDRDDFLLAFYEFQEVVRTITAEDRRRSKKKETKKEK